MEAKSPNPVQLLSKAVGREWPAIDKARIETQEVRHTIADALRAELGRLESDIDVVVFGSLAREEWTSGSDVDWTLLIDGQAVPDHQKTAQAVREALESIRFRNRPLQPPGPTGVFGSLTFSHDLIHRIGGDADSNRNTTRRILMLLESHPIRTDDENGPRAYERTTASIVERYLRNDANLSKAKSTVPRFLLNDMVRYWRTLCVDFAWKEWEQAGEKWALRNVKLRMSRKLLFVSALLTVFACDAIPEYTGEPVVLSQLMKSVDLPPNQVVAAVLAEHGLVNEAAQLLDHYNTFLAIIDDEENRSHLQSLPARDVYDDPLFLDLRNVSHAFQDIIADIFFAQTSPLSNFTRDYGVF